MVIKVYNFKQSERKFKIFFQKYKGNYLKIGGLFIYFNKSVLTIFL
jgi:hypothetical protein